MGDCVRNLEKLIYTLTEPEAEKHDCVFVISEKHAATYQKEDHSVIELGQNFIIYNLLDKSLKVEVTVFYIQKNTGIIILEARNDYSFESFSESTWHTDVPRPYSILGINQVGRTPLWQHGTLLKESACGMYNLGSTDGMLGNPVFDEYKRFVGMVVTKRNDKILVLMSRLITCHVPHKNNGNKFKINLEKALYTSTIPASEGHRTVFAISEKFAVSYGHGGHSKLKPGNEVVLFNVLSSQETKTVKVKELNVEQDYVVFEILNREESFRHYHVSHETPFRGQQYDFCAVGQDRRPIWKSGIISFIGTGSDTFVYGASQAVKGDSGGFFISKEGHLIGMNSGKKDFVPNPKLGTTGNIIMAAEHRHVCRIVPEDLFMQHVETANNAII